jgi:hypothetical protein
MSLKQAVVSVSYSNKTRESSEIIFVFALTDRTGNDDSYHRAAGQ